MSTGERLRQTRQLLRGRAPGSRAPRRRPVRCETPTAPASAARPRRSSWRRAPTNCPNGGHPVVSTTKGDEQSVATSRSAMPRKSASARRTSGAGVERPRLPAGVGGLRDVQELDDGGLGEASPERARGAGGGPAAAGPGWEPSAIGQSPDSRARTAMSRVSRSAEGWTVPFSQRRMVSSLTWSCAASWTRRRPARLRDASRCAPRRGDQVISSVPPPAALSVPAVVRPRMRYSLESSPSLVNPLRARVTT